MRSHGIRYLRPREPRFRGSRSVVEPRRVLPLVVLSVFVLVGGCEFGQDRDVGVYLGQVHDSAGIRIVEHEEIPDELATWSLERVPGLKIGAVEGEGPEVFGNLFGVVERADGVVVVLDSQARELRAFDGRGEHLWTAGGPGDGPGELGSIRGRSLFLLPGDSVLVWDSSRWASVFGPTGAFGRRFSPEPAGISMTVVGVFPDGGLVAYAGERREPEGFNRLLIYYDADGRVQDEVVGRFGPSEVTGEARIVTGAPAGGVGAVVVRRDRAEIRRYDPDGDLSMILRLGVEPDPWDRARLLEAGLTEGQAEILEEHAASALRHNVINQVLVDFDERLWVQEYVPGYYDGATRWWIFDAEGVLLAQMALPERFGPWQINSTHVVGVTRDEMGVQYVERRGILPAAPGVEPGDR